MIKRFYMAMMACLLLAGTVVAQTPRWAEKARQAVFSIISYDAEGKMLASGNGFFVTADGLAFSDYALFNGAARAEVIDAAGRRMPVLEMVGANDTYDVVKFRVDLKGQSASPLDVATALPAVGARVYLLPYSTQRNTAITSSTLRALDKLEGNYRYLTIGVSLNDKMVSCPIVDEAGRVIGVAQKATDAQAAECYAVDARYVLALSASALSVNDAALGKIGIRKALPDDEQQALAALYMAVTSPDRVAYGNMLNHFVEKFPGNADGYVRRANYIMDQSNSADAVKRAAADLDRALEVAADKGEIYYDRAVLMVSYVESAPEQPSTEWTVEQALQDVRSAVAVADLPAYRNLEAEILFSMNDYAGALAALEKVNASVLASAQTYYSAALCKEKMERPFEETIALMDSCMAKFDKPYTIAASPYLSERARMYIAAGKPRQALGDYDSFLDAAKGQVDDQFYYLRAQAAMQAKAYQRAIDDYAKAIELNPNDLVYPAELAAVNMRVGRNEEAIKILDAALAIDGKYAELHRLKGLAYLQMKKNKDARASLNKALELGDEMAEGIISKYFKK